LITRSTDQSNSRPINQSPAH